MALPSNLDSYSMQATVNKHLPFQPSQNRLSNITFRIKVKVLIWSSIADVSVLPAIQPAICISTWGSSLNTKTEL